MCWEETASEVMTSAGYAIIEADGIDDWQGWGVLLGRSSENKWAVLAWTYGSCSVCDSYKDMTQEERDEAFKSLIEPCQDEKAARALFSARKGW